MSTWHNHDSNTGHPDPKAKCLPLDHNTLYQIANVSYNIWPICILFGALLHLLGVVETSFMESNSFAILHASRAVQNS